jgi:O-antigen/teichoic acid export membrane protein
VGDDAGGIQRLIGKVWGEVKSPLYRNALFMMFNSIAGIGLGFVFFIIVARVYRSADIGFAVTLFSTISFVATLALLGLGMALIRFLPEMMAAEDRARLLNTSLTLAGLAALLLAGGSLLVIAIAGLDLSFVLAEPIYIVAIVLGTLAITLGSVMDNAAIGLRRADAQMWRNAFIGVAKIPIALAIAFTLSSALGVGRLGVFLALVLGTGASTLFAGYWLFPHLLPGYRPRLEFAFRRLRPMFRFSAGNHVAISLGAAGSGLLTLMILNVRGSVASAYFYYAAAGAALLSIIPGATFSSFFAEASRPNADRHRDERRALVLTLALLAPAIVILFVFAHVVLQVLFTGEFANGAFSAFRILVVGAVPAVLGNVLMTRVRIRKRTLPLIVGAILSAVVNLGLGYIMLQAYGIDGLAVATVLAAVAPLPYYWAVARKSFEGEPLEPVDPTLWKI